MRVAEALGDNRVLELREGAKHAELQPRHGATHRREGAVDEGDFDVEVLEEVEEPHQVHQLARQAVDPVHHHVVDITGLDGQQEFEEPIPVHRRAALALVVEALDEAPAGRGTLVDEGQAALRLKLARREHWVDAGARHRLPRVDGAANGLASGRATGSHEEDECS